MNSGRSRRITVYFHGNIHNDGSSRKITVYFHGNILNGDTQSTKKGSWYTLYFEIFIAFLWMMSKKQKVNHYKSFGQNRLQWQFSFFLGLPLLILRRQPGDWKEKKLSRCWIFWKRGKFYRIMVLFLSEYRILRLKRDQGLSQYFEYYDI